MKINLLKRFSNKAFCAAFAAAVILLLQQVGLGEFIPANIMDVINTILLLLSMLGIVVDPTSKGIGDSQMVLDGDSSDDLKQEIQELGNALDAKEDELKETTQKLDELLKALEAREE